MFKMLCTKCPNSNNYRWAFDKNKPTAYCHSCKSKQVVIEEGDILTYYDNKQMGWKVNKTALRWFRAYQKVQKSGKFNMITEASEAADKAGILLDQCLYVIENYSKLEEASRALMFHEV